jgi:ribose 5-phosphate isomerase A
LESLGAKITLRQGNDGAPFKTDQGNLILDCRFGPIPQPAQLAAQMSGRAGIVEHGMFLELVTDVIVANDKGIQHLKKRKDDQKPKHS